MAQNALTPDAIQSSSVRLNKRHLVMGLSDTWCGSQKTQEKQAWVTEIRVSSDLSVNLIKEMLFLKQPDMISRQINDSD